MRCFEDDNVIHVAAKVTAISRPEVLQTGCGHPSFVPFGKRQHRCTRTTQFVTKENRGDKKAPGVPICAKFEAGVGGVGDEGRQMFLEELGQTEPGLNRLIRSAYSLLGLQTYFTAGVKEVRPWTIHVGDTGP